MKYSELFIHPTLLYGQSLVTTKRVTRNIYYKPSLRIIDCNNNILVGSPAVVETAGQENGGFYDISDDETTFNDAWGN